MVTRTGEHDVFSTHVKRKRSRTFATLAFYAAIAMSVLALVLAGKAAYGVLYGHFENPWLVVPTVSTDATLITWVSWCLLSLIALGFAILAWHFQKSFGLTVVAFAVIALTLDSSALLLVMRSQAMGLTSADPTLLIKTPRALPASDPAGDNGSVIVPVANAGEIAPPVPSIPRVVIKPDAKRSSESIALTDTSPNAATDVKPPILVNASSIPVPHDLASINAAIEAAEEISSDEEIDAMPSPRSNSGPKSGPSSDPNSEPTSELATALASVDTQTRTDGTLPNDIRTRSVKRTATDTPEPVTPPNSPADLERIALLSQSTDTDQAASRAADPQPSVTPDSPTEALESEVVGAENTSEALAVKADALDTDATGANTRDADSSDADNWVIAASPKHFTMQLFVAESEKLAQDFIREHALQNASYFAQRKGDSVLYKVVYGSYPTFDEAQQAVNDIPSSLSSISPWVRSLANVQAEANTSS